MNLRIRWFIAGILCFLVISDVIRIKTDDALPGTVGYSVETYLFMPGVGLWKPMTGRCKNSKVRNYFNCTSLQTKLSDLIYE
jgi:hypothetical protein